MPVFEIRPATEEELPELFRVIEATFGEHLDDETVEAERTVLPLDRTVAILEGDGIVGGAASYPFEMTVPGGATLPVAGVTAVGVSATHRRRGLLRAMMEHQLDDIDARDEPIAILNASEAPIYGRFGYGLASSYQRLAMDPRLVSFTRRLPDRFLRLVPQDHALDALRAAHDAVTATRPGAVRRSEAWWQIMLGERESWKGGGKWFVVVVDPDGDDPGGYALYKMTDFGPDGGLAMTAREVVAATPDTEALLWHHLLSVDLVWGIDVSWVPMDCELRWWVDDARQIRTTTVRDYLWVRLLDIPRALATRRYSAPGDVVLEVADRTGRGGTFRLEVDDHGRATCEQVEAKADLACSVGSLGSIYLGGVGIDTLARAGRVEASSVEVLGRVAAMFAWHRAPHCDTTF